MSRSPARPGPAGFYGQELWPLRENPGGGESGMDGGRRSVGMETANRRGRQAARQCQYERGRGCDAGPAGCMEALSRRATRH